jgi:hypothetical protein
MFKLFVLCCSLGLHAAGAWAQSEKTPPEKPADDVPALAAPAVPATPDDAQQRRLALRAALGSQRSVTEQPEKLGAVARQLNMEERATLRQQLRQQRH